MASSISSRLDWYITHRLEFLRYRRERLKLMLDGRSVGDMDFEALREMVELTGRIRELERLSHQAESW